MTHDYYEGGTRGVAGDTACGAADGPDSVERIWHIQDSQGQVLALTFRFKSLRYFKLFPLQRELDKEAYELAGLLISRPV